MYFIHDTMDNMRDHPAQILERARRNTRNDWMADAILLEAQRAIRNLQSQYYVSDFARIILNRLRIKAS